MHTQASPEPCTHRTVQQVSQIVSRVLAPSKQSPDRSKYCTERYYTGNAPGDQGEDQDLGEGWHNFALVASIFSLTCA